MKISYFIHQSVEPFVGDEGKDTNFELKKNNDGFQIIAESPFSDLKYCFLDIELPNGIDAFSKFTLTCAENADCYMAYKGDMRDFGEVSITGDGDESVVSANF